MTTPPPYETEFPGINVPNIVPGAFKDTWEPILEKWGKTMKQAVANLAEMTAVGLGLEQTYFTDAAKYGYVLFRLAFSM